MRKIKGDAPTDTKHEIINVLQILQKGYLERNLAEVDRYMEMLFNKDEDNIIIGTSDEEWFFNYDEAKELITSDWEWWGDVTFNIDETIISTAEDIVWLTTSGTVKYQYDNSEKTYERWFNQVIKENYFKDDRKFDKDSLKNDFLEINWKLNHKLHDWGSDSREYLSPMRFSAVLKKVEGNWIFKQIQFSFPQPFYPDMRIDSNEMKKERFESIQQKIGYYKQRILPKSQMEIKYVLNEFQKDYLDSSSVKLNNLVKKYFIQNDKTTVIGTDNTRALGLDSIKKLVSTHRLSWDKISIHTNEAIINEHHDVTWFATTGTITENLDEEAALKKQYDSIKGIIESDIAPKEKLFKIRRNISMTLKEIAKGEEHLWPFRLEGVLVKENGSWKFHYLQFSFPFYYIYEGLREDVLLVNVHN